MARPRQHDISEVRLAAMHCFWENGYSNTSMALLQKATGIDKKQLIRDFGSKSNLFIELLDEFFVILKEQQLSRLEVQTAGVEDIRRVLGAMASRSSELNGKFGCMVCNTSLDHAAMSDPRISALVKSFFEYVEKAYRTALLRARERRELSLQDDEVVRLGRSLLGAQIAVMLLLRTGVSEAVLQDIVKQALHPLDSNCEKS